ncbi:MAG: hypothetical protein KJ831_16565, partial [Candidatus Eisenbacteria bacterium]|nr:hypothetical protein [Candidatus Eisenbacteria bacterium]
MLEWIVEKYAEFGWTAALAVGWCLIIIIWALSAYYLGFRRKTKPLKVLVEKAKEKIKSIECSEAFVKGFEDFNAFATATPAIEPSWTEFKKALVYPHKDETQKIKSTVDSNYFFNFTTIVENNVDLRFYNEFPNYLTGTGILGTFVGLTIGIFLARAGLVSAEVELMRGALSNLLGGASLAFSTSLVGLFFSLIVSWKMKSWLYKIQVGIEEWCDILDAHLERVTIEGLTQENLSESKRQTVQLERFNTDLAISISSALDERLAGRFGPLLERSITALEGIKADRQEGQEKLLRDMVAEFKNTLSGAAGTEMTAIGDTLRELGHSMKETADRLTGAGNEAGEGFVAASKSAADEMRALI